jgi:capsid portal protein
VSEVDVDKAVELDVAVAEVRSEQPADEGSSFWTPSDSIAPPADLEYLAKLTQTSPLRRSCIAAIVQNTVGLGWSIVPREGHEDQMVDDEPEEVMARLNAAARQDSRSGRPNFRKLLRRIAWDKQEVGNGALEVARNRLDGEISGLFHAPGKRVRRLTSRTGWVIGPKSGAGRDQVRFYDFGHKVARTEEGRPQGLLAGSASEGFRWAKNELLTFQLYTSESRDYGLPPDAQLAWDYLGDKLAAEHNIGFFDNAGVPPTVIFVQGEVIKDGPQQRVKVNDGVVRRLQDIMVGGPRRSRIAVVPLPPGAKAEKIDLAVMSERDMGFTGFRADNRRRTLGAWRISPVFVADIEDAGKYTAEVERAITKEQVFDPEQQDWRDDLDVLLADMGKPHLTFRFDEIRIDSDETRRSSANEAARVGAITNGEFRDRHNLPPLPEAQENAEPKPGEVPFGWNAQLMKSAAAAVEAGPEEIEKASGDFEAMVREDFEVAVEDAMRRVAEHVGQEFDLAPVTIEKDGDRIVVSPVAA